jgi:hypothetical protein
MEVRGSPEMLVSTHKTSVTSQKLAIYIIFLTCMKIKTTIINIILEPSASSSPKVAQPLKKFPAFYGSGRFIVMFTRVLH